VFYLSHSDGKDSQGIENRRQATQPKQRTETMKKDHAVEENRGDRRMTTPHPPRRYVELVLQNHVISILEGGYIPLNGKELPCAVSPAVLRKRPARTA